VSTPSAIGPFEVIRELGRGGMGVVLEVRHPQIPRRLALKQIHADGGEAFARFEREAKLLARVSHPNVVAIHTLDRDKGQPYLVTDLVEGRNLKAVAREAPLAPERAARIVVALASGVAAIHAKGILHRDLKPENVILGADDSPVLLDFGLAREADARSLTQSGTLVGTPAYMAPEQASGEGSHSLDARTDVYGLGAILFELLAGRPPFEGDGPVQLIAAVIMKEPRWPSATRSDVPPELEALLRSTLAKSRKDRPPTAQALADELGRFLRGELATASPARGRRWLAAGVAGLVLAALLGGAAFTRKSVPPVPVLTPAPPASNPKPTGPPPLPPGKGRSPGSFRAILRWLEREDVRLPQARNEARGQLESARHAPLARVPAPEGLIYVRFLTNRWLAVLANHGSVQLLDLNAPDPSTLSDLCVLPGSVESGYRAWDLAASEPGPDGTLRVFVASHRGLWAMTFHPGDTPWKDAKLVHVWGSEDDVVKAVALSPDGEALAFGCRSSVWLREHPSSEIRGIPLDAPNGVRSLAFLADGRLLVGSSLSNSTSSLTLLDRASGAPPVPLNENGDVHGLAATRRRTGEGMVAFAPGFGLQVAPAGLADLGALKASPWVIGDGPVNFGALAFGGTRDGGRLDPLLYAVTRRLDEGDSRLTVWDPGTMERPIREVPRRRGAPDSIAVSPDGALVAIGDAEHDDPSVQIWGAGD
jgi:serine/threonine protein kinase